MTRQLRQQHTAYAFNAEGKRRMLHHGFVTHLQDTAAELGLILFFNALGQIINPGLGVTQTRAERNDFFRSQRMANEFDVQLVYCFEKAGVLRDENDDDSVIGLVDRDIYTQLRNDGIVVGGMIPKLDNAFEAIDAGVSEVIITKASSLDNLALGTHIK